MIPPVKIAQHTSEWGLPEDGHITIYTRDELEADGTNIMVSQWQPTPEQLVTLLNGGYIFLGIKGTIHPPILLGVGNAAPAEETPHD